ncbi:cytochrome c [Marinospirillum minutulum]|uniref:cytochrome c n=1 Tax=Marinospirillum minutulum TaxID=64974 RepID=UPI000410C0A4|nr:cytochrome c [Marinospirillum minutulum]
MLSNLVRFMASLLLTGWITTAIAQPQNTTEGISAEDVNLRIDTFDEIDQLFKALRFKVVNQRSTNREAALDYSSKLVKLSYRLPDLFDLPSSRESFPQSRSRPEIWTKKEYFDQQLEAFVVNLEKIDDEIRAGDLSRAGRLIDETAKGCRRCHNGFRYR